MKTIIFVLQVVGTILGIAGAGFLFGASHILGCFEEAELSIDVSFWSCWMVFIVGALLVLFGHIAEFIYDAGYNSAAKED